MEKELRLFFFGVWLLYVGSLKSVRQVLLSEKEGGAYDRQT